MTDVYSARLEIPTLNAPKLNSTTDIVVGERGGDPRHSVHVSQVATDWMAGTHDHSGPKRWPGSVEQVTSRRGHRDCQTFGCRKALGRSSGEEEISLGKEPGKWYVRLKGQYYPLRHDKGSWLTPGTQDFDAAYWKILTGKKADAKRSWSVLIKDMRNTDKWADFSPRYRADLEKSFQYLEEKIGKADVARLSQADIYDAMEANKHRVRFVNNLPTAISMLSKLAIRKRWRLDNPAIDIEPLRVPRAKKKPHTPWPDWAVDIWRQEAEPIPRLIFEIGVGSVQRPGDCVDFTWGDYDGESLRLRQNKTGVQLKLPCTAMLKAALDEAKASLDVFPPPSRHILTRADGSAMDYHAMARVMIRERKRLDLMAFDQHALRYRGVMELAWEGCDDDEIASFSGHTAKAMIVKYAGEARQIQRARKAAEKRK